MEEDVRLINLLSENVESLTTEVVQDIIDGSDEALVFFAGDPFNRRGIEPDVVRRIHTRDANTTARLIVERLRSWNKRRQRACMDHSRHLQMINEHLYHEIEEADKELKDWLYGPGG